MKITVSVRSLLLIAPCLILVGSPRPNGSQNSPSAPLFSRDSISFERDIRPILERNCYRCHGSETQRSGLRLDSRSSALKGGLHGPILLPGDAEHSPLYQRIAGMGEITRMPFDGDPLPQPEIERIRAWIDQGAEWPETASDAAGEIKTHWAYVPPSRPVLPSVGNSGWIRNPIDSFVLARLEKEGLKPSPEADRATLLRRLSLDLIGLPPSLEEMSRFLGDSSPEAYDREVARLLSSPHYGERWARHWLDLASYADSDGFEKDKSRQVWAYRDWVIGALNQDTPYDRFIIEQIAGDLLPARTQKSLIATGFLRNSMLNEEGGIHPEQFRMEAMFHRMETVGRVLGVTIQCAQCHNHKFDPLTQIEYYQLFAFLNDCHEASIPVYTPQEEDARLRVLDQVGALESELKLRHPDWQERMASWEKSLPPDPIRWQVFVPEVDDITTGGQKLLPMPDGSFLAQGYAPTRNRVQLTLQTEVRGITGFRLELMTDPNLPLGGPGRSIKGMAALTEFEVETLPAGASGDKTKVTFARATADVNPPEAPLDANFYDKTKRYRVTGPIEYAIDGKDETAWGIDMGPGRSNQPRKAVFVPETPIGQDGPTTVVIYLNQKHGGWNSDDNQTHNLGRYRLSLTTDRDPVADAIPVRIREILAVPSGLRSSQQEQELFSFWRTTVPEWAEANQRIEKIWCAHPQGSSQLVLTAREEPRTTYVLRRGDFLRPAAPIEPAVPKFLHSMPERTEPDRLAFARWLVSPDSPTTARAMVNRVWQAYFGIGLVESSEDLGVQAEPPSHPQLLDWLAVEFMEKGWSLKELHRLIVTSASYRQSSRVTPELLERDPYNRLLARGARFRVDAEIIRDIALAASGLLVPKVGGPSVHPPAPDFLFVPPSSYGPKVWKESEGEDRYRRALYTFRFRSLPYPSLQVFDAPSGEASCTRRPRSNTPLQALTLLNEPLFMEAARALALLTLEEGSGSSESQRLDFAFRRCLSRPPTPAESQELLGLLNRQRERFERGELNAWDLAAADPDAPPALPAESTPAELAAWTVVSRVLLNLDETVTKE